MELGIKDRLALVTGASKGIGRGIALELAREGARVIMVARSQDALLKVRDETGDPTRHHVLAVDLIAADGPRKVAEAALEMGEIDIAVHNLGGTAGVYDVFASAEDWGKVWHFNVGIGHELNRLLIPPMIERKWGRVVHVSSQAGHLCHGHAPAYSMAKAALDAYVKNVARIIAKDNVILSAVIPGAIYTEGRFFAKMQNENPAVLEAYFNDHLPVRRLGTPEDIAPLVAYLCSKQASFMSAALVSVDGGGM